jgi:hypothetical protein
MFGELSLSVRSRIKQGEVLAELKLPQRTVPSKALLRLRLPEGWKLIGAAADGKKLDVNGETIDISPLRGDIVVRASVARAK